MPPGRSATVAMERLMRIMAVLDNAGKVGVPATRLMEVADYGDADPGTQLSRDLRNLASQGWRIDNVADQGMPARYRMTTVDNRLGLALTTDQSAALQRALILADRAQLAATMGIEAAAMPGPATTAVASSAPAAELDRALGAVQTRSRIRFSYKGRQRVVHPSTVRLQNHRWYLAGVEDGADLIKHFAIERMSDVRLDDPGSADEVERIRKLELHPLTWLVDDPSEVVVRTTSEFRPDVERWLRAPDHVVESETGVDLTYTVTNRTAFRSRIYTLGKRVQVVTDTFRAEIVAELEEIVGTA